MRVPGTVRKPGSGYTACMYLSVTNALALLRLLPMSDCAKVAEILALRHRITVLETATARQ